MNRATEVESKKGVFFPGLVTSDKSMEKFAGALVNKQLIDEHPEIITVHTQRTAPEVVEASLRGSSRGVFHSMGELALKQAWPERAAFIISPPTPRSALDLVMRSIKVVRNIAEGSRASQTHLDLFKEGAAELADHPLTALTMGVKGVNYDSINRLASYYFELSKSERPDVHVIVSPRDPLFNYDEKFEDDVEKAEFKLHHVDCGHNGLYTRPERVLDIVVQELEKL